MWYLIESQADIKKIMCGRIITQRPDDPIDRYEITAMDGCCVRAMHNNGKVSLKIFSRDDLVRDHWWVFETL
jgi:hypothetical protein